MGEMGEMGESGDWPRSTGSSRPFIDPHAERNACPVVSKKSLHISDNADIFSVRNREISYEHLSR